MSLFGQKSTSSLVHLDPLYKNVISKLPITNRIRYCKSFIYRIKDDILNTKCKSEKRKLKNILNAVESELKILICKY